MEFNISRLGTDLYTPRDFDSAEVDCNEQDASPGVLRWALTSVTNLIIQNTVGDLPYLISNPEKFITTDLYQRAAETGVAQAYIGPKLLCDLGYLPTITLVSGDRAMVSQITSYDDEDPASRASFKILNELSGVTSIVNKTGEEAGAERTMIKHQLVGPKALSDAYHFTLDLIGDHFQLWDDAISVQDHITYISANVIGRCVFGLPHVPMEYAHLLQAAGRLVVNPRPDPAEVTRLAQQIKAMSDDLMKHPDAGKFGGYPLLQLKLTGKESPEEILAGLNALNAGADIIVEGNLSFLILSGILLISQYPDVQARLRNELHGFDWHQENAYEALCKLSYLDCVYTELLRHPSPTGMLDRQVSRPYTIKGKAKNGSRPIYHIGGQSLFTPLLGNSHMMVCVSSIHHDPRFFTDPNEFNPSRFEGEEGAEIKKYIMPFSVGKRSCPAGSTEGNGFSATVAKLAIAYFTMNYDLELHSELEDVPSDSFYRRWETVYASVSGRKSRVS